MTEENKEIMTKQDIDLLLAGFPDLKDNKDFPKEPTSAAVVDFAAGYMEKCGVEGRPSEMLEYLAVAASMKAVAQASLRECNGSAYKQLSLSNEAAGAELAQIADGKVSSIAAVNEDVRKSISNMDFKTVAAMYPMQAFMRQNFETEFGKIDMETADDKVWNRVASIAQFGGNETGARDFEPGEFTKTAGYRVRQSVTNNLFDNYACLHLVANAVQVRSALTLADKFPQMSDSLKENNAFFATHAAESLAVCHAVEESGLKLNNPKLLQDMVVAPETKDFAYGSYAPVFLAYSCLADAQKGQCPLVFGDREKPGEISMPRDLSKAENGDKFMASVQKQAAQSLDGNRQVMTISSERLRA